MADGKKGGNEKRRPPLNGFAIAASFWWWEVLAIYSPVYVHAAIWWHPVAYIAAAVFMTIGLAGTGVELGGLRKNEAWEYWGVSLVFLFLLEFFIS